MKDEGNVADYMASLNRARRRRRNRPPYGKYALAAAVVCVAAAGIFFGGRAVKGYMDKKPAAATETSEEGETGPEAGTLDESALAAEEASARPGMRSGLPTPRLWWIPMPISGSSRCPAI